MSNLDKLDSILDGYKHLTDFLEKHEYEIMKQKRYIEVIENMYIADKVDFKLCGPYIERLWDKEKQEVYKYIRRQKSNQELNVWDYIINVLDFYK